MNLTNRRWVLPVLIMSIGLSLFGNSPDSLLVELSRQHGFAKADIHRQLAVEYRDNLAYDLAVENYMAAIMFFKRVDSIKQQVNTMIDLGTLYRRNSQADKALELLAKARLIAERNKLQNQLGAIHNDMALTYTNLGDFANAVESYLTAMTFYEKVGDMYGQGATLSNLSQVYKKFKKLDKAMDYAKKAYKIGKPVSDDVDIGLFLLNIGNIYSKKKDYKNVTKYNFQALDYFKKAKDENRIAMALRNIANAYAYQGDLVNAEKYTFRSLDIAKKTKRSLGEIYYNLGDLSRMQGKFERALYYLEKAEQNKQYSNIGNLETYILGTFAEVYEAKKDYKNALVFHKKYIAHKDSLSGERVQKSIEKLKSKYESERKDSEIALLSKENIIKANRIRKNTLLMSGLAFFTGLLILLGWLVYRQKRMKASQQKSLLEQKLLRSQMNPHFIFNALSSIQAYMMKEGAKPAVSYLSSFAKLMRSILESSRNEYIPLDEEIDAIENYLRLQKLRFNDAFDYQINVQEGIDTAEINIPPMLTQPFIENAVKHGVNKIDYRGKIIVNFTLDGNQLKVTVLDNGKGINNKTGEKQTDLHKSAALEITKARLASLNESKKQKTSFSIKDRSEQDSEQSGTEVVFLVTTY